MAKRARPTFRKRQREMARQQRQQDKMAKRLAPRDQGGESSASPKQDVDPDIAGIVPGPQPVPEWVVTPGAKLPTEEPKA